MNIELFGGPLDGVTLEHDVEGEAELLEEPWLGVIWLEEGQKYGAVYEYKGSGYAVHSHSDLEH